MFNSSLGWLRLVGMLEGISYLVLLCIAMPLKYWAGMPMAVMIAGSIHGGLFVLYVLLVLQVWITLRWSFWRAALAGLASVVPFLFIKHDKMIKVEQEKQEVKTA